MYRTYHHDTRESLKKPLNLWELNLKRDKLEEGNPFEKALPMIVSKENEVQTCAFNSEMLLR